MGLNERVIENASAEIIVIILAVISLSVIYAADYSQKKASTAFENYSISAHFCHYENCTAVIISELSNSRDVKCAFYTIRSSGLIKALAAVGASLALGDKKTYDYAKQAYGSYSSAILTYRKDNSRGIMHNKFCIYTKAASNGKSPENQAGEYVITGSYNPKDKGAEEGYDSVIIIRSDYAHDNYEAEADELLLGEFAKGNPTTITAIRSNGNANDDANGTNSYISTYFCPDDGCIGRINSQIESAKGSIDIMSYVITAYSIRENIMQKAEQGVKIRLIADRSLAFTNYSIVCALKNAGIESYVYDGPGIMHHKSIIIDSGTDMQVIIDGSMNPTENGNLHNDENTIILHDEAEVENEYESEFNKILNSEYTRPVYESDCIG